MANISPLTRSNYIFTEKKFCYSEIDPKGNPIEIKPEETCPAGTSENPVVAQVETASTPISDNVSFDFFVEQRRTGPVVAGIRWTLGNQQPWFGPSLLARPDKTLSPSPFLSPNDANSPDPTESVSIPTTPEEPKP